MEFSGNHIHPTAILDGNIRMGQGNTIGPGVVMRGNIEIGDHNIFSAGVFLENNVRIGHHNRIFAYTCIGAIGEMGLKGDRLAENGMVRIGDRVMLREFVCIHSPVYHEATVIEDDVYLMNKCYVAHDCTIGHHTVMSAGASLGGRCTVGHRANIGMGAVVHQQRAIGQGSMVGMGSAVTRDILPYAKVAGCPARILGFNEKGAMYGAFDRHWLDEMIIFFSTKIDPAFKTDNPLKREVYDFLEKYPESLVDFVRP